MAGPEFRFYLPTFSTAMISELDSILTSISTMVLRREPRSTNGTLFYAELHVETSFIPTTDKICVNVTRHDEGFYSDALTRAFNDIFGFAPLVEIGGSCMADSEDDWDALRLIARRVSATFGALVVLERNDGSLPDLPSDYTVDDHRVREVLARGDDAFFGDTRQDRLHVPTNQQRVSVERYWVIDSTISPGFWVQK